MSSASQWASRLGMAMTGLFPVRSAESPPGDHYAMLDGQRASFACSTAEANAIPREDSQHWQWSADLSHHVILGDTLVEVRSGREFRCFQRDSVESRLESFLEFLDIAGASALPDVVVFLTDEFRQIRATTHDDPTGQTALSAFLFALRANGGTDLDVLTDKSWRQSIADEIGINPPSIAEDSLLKYARGMQQGTPAGLRLVPALVLRHTAGRLFQEAHAILESVQPGLFDRASMVLSQNFSPTGAYFTPVPIARLLAEWALREPLPDRITIADFACGSAVFLTEALRTLERLGFSGTVRLIGRDKSDLAVTMAKVAVQTVRHDLTGIQVEADIEKADALESPWPKADIILMNPPFRSWEQMTPRERSWVAESVEGGRPDLCIGFVERALQSLRPHGVLATLVPAGVLASESVSKWRRYVASRAVPSLVVVLGEHGLFQHALVNVGAISLHKNGSAPLPASQSLYVGWASANTGAASRTIRALRRSLTRPIDTEFSGAGPKDWRVTRSTLASWNQRHSWLPGAGALGPLLDTVIARNPTRVMNLFHVRQGIRSGAKKVFLQPLAVVDMLPQGERKYFKPAVDTASFVDGEIKPHNYVFLADDAWRTETEVKEAIPAFFNERLIPARSLLTERRSLKDMRWWRLTRARKTWLAGGPRLLSKRFGLYPAFARDFDARFAPVQANAWKPTRVLEIAGGSEILRDVLTAYWWLLNSRVAVALFREYCPNVAGGQLDLEHKYVQHVPLPDLVKEFEDNPDLQRLAMSLRTRYGDDLPRLADRDRFGAAAFGTSVSDWNLSGLESPD